MPPRKSPVKRKASAVATRQQKAKLAEAANGDAQQFSWPAAGWPKEDSNVVNTTEHDKPHAQATEYWTVQSQFQDGTARRYAVFATFAKLAVSAETDGVLVHWSLVEEETQQVWSTPLADSNAVKYLVQSMRNGAYELDPRLKEAFLEVFEAEKFPQPDRWSKQEAECSPKQLRLVLEENSLSKSPKGQYVLKCGNNESKVAFELILNPGKAAAVRLGANGLVQQNVSNMFAYVIPGCQVSGTVTINEEARPVRGSADFLRKFSAPPGSEMRDDPEQAGVEDEEKGESAEHQSATSPFGRNYQWRQVSLVLSDGSQMFVTASQNAEGYTTSQSSVIVMPDGEVKSTQLVQFVPSPKNASNSNLRAEDTSMRTTQYFPSQWTLIADGGRYNLDVSMVFREQEFCSWFSNPSYWHGRVRVTGLLNGEDIVGQGFLELHPNRPVDSLNAFFGRINHLVLAEIERLMPRDPTYEQVRDLMTTPKAEHYMNGANVNVFRDTVIKPLRDYVDRGFGDEGAGWRTFCMLMCMDAVGGNCSNFRNWLSMPELMHVGSLVIDDIEDEAESRRGGPSSHKTYGTAIAINAGSAAYFMSLFVLQKGTPNLSDRTRIRLYEYYMVKMRCGHVGQAFDIEGLDKFVPAAIATGDSAVLEERIQVIHRMKMAVPSGCLARMGALVGGANPDQQHTIGVYVEAIGVASEVVRSIQSLLGENGDHKQGRMLRHGKITLPVAKAFSLLKTVEERQVFWELIVKARQEEHADAAVKQIAAKLKALDALQAAKRDVEQAVSDSWAKVNEVLPESFSKLMLRSFASFVLSQVE